MRRRARWLWLVGSLLLLVSPPLGADDYDPFQIPREAFRARVRTLALWPLALPPSLAHRSELRPDFERRIATALEGHGLRVVASSVVESEWRRLSAGLGGIHDPFDGQPDEERRALAWEYLLQELRISHGADAVLRAAIRFDRMGAVASRHAAMGHWAMPEDNPIIWGDGKLGASAQGYPLAVVGPYLVVFIVDREGAELYNVRVPIEWSEVYHNTSRSRVPQERLLTSAPRNERAVAVALEDLDPVDAAPRE